MDKTEQNKKVNKAAGFRKAVQAGWGILTNGYIKGFLPGNPVIYQGKLKQICVPGMNCYSCPGALGSCPIGSMQAVFDRTPYMSDPTYVYAFSPNGLTFFFNAAVLSPHSDGGEQIDLTYDDLSSVLSDKYLHLYD